METSVYYPVLVLTHIISEESNPNSKYTAYYQEREDNHFSLVEFLEPKIESIQEGEAGDLHLYTDIRLDTTMGHFELLLPHLIVTKGMYPLWSLSKMGRIEYIISELRKIISPYCKKKGNTYIVKYPGQEESGFEVESRWTESSSDPRYLECRQFTVTVRKNKMVTRSEGVSAFISTVLAQSPNLIACLNMVSGEKMTLECIDTDLSDYEITVSPPTSDDSNIFVLDFIKSRYKHERPIKLGSNLDLPDILKLISGY